LANESAVILENSRLFERFLSQQQEQFRLRAILEQYVAPAVAERLISGRINPTLEGTRHTVSVLMVDMRGFTPLAVGLDPAITHSVMNDYLGAMTDELFHFEGT